MSAPQKAWTGPAAAGLCMMSPRGYDRVTATTSNSMALNLKKWRDVMEAYLDETKGDGPGFAYYTTMPTDALQLFRDAAVETQKIGWKKVEERFEAQGKKVYDLLDDGGQIG